MPPKRELSLEQIQELRSLRGQLPAAEAKKRFGIGTTRLYKIWRDESASSGSSSGGTSTSGAKPATYPSEASPLRVTMPGISAVTDQQASVAEQRGGTPDNQLPAVADFYNRLGRLESHAEQATNLLVQLLAQLSHSDDSESDLLEELVAAEHDKEIAEQVQETHMALQKVGQMVETAQKWAYISIAGVLIWKVAATTRNRCTSAAVGCDTQKHVAMPQRTTMPPLPAAENVKPGDPFYMA